MAKIGQDILTVKALAAEMGIMPEEAQTLMEREDFPATEIATGAFVVARSLYEKWVYEHSRGYVPFDMENFMNG